ncbi:hypothetical protein GGX14DRAFT_397334 [Mycena pura]|uniref:Uncharacterized protein n=1 Tax=Mycena pura TaxID=153505 RepID=A0AAD6V966_9AGAR|nr:hypothetical protein GGX14DRAFT_397334 [Mycena pura]
MSTRQGLRYGASWRHEQTGRTDVSTIGFDSNKVRVTKDDRNMKGFSLQSCGESEPESRFAAIIQVPWEMGRGVMRQDGHSVGNQTGVVSQVYLCPHGAPSPNWALLGACGSPIGSPIGHNWRPIGCQLGAEPSGAEWGLSAELGLHPAAQARYKTQVITSKHFSYAYASYLNFKVLSNLLLEAREAAQNKVKIFSSYF